jgi:Response regulator containing CheY-like receiver domain and AraC-type DNA-binding domain
MIRILIADDHPFVRRGVKQVLTDEFPGVVIGEASTAPELLELAGKHPVEFGRTGPDMPVGTGWMPCMS